MAASTPRAAAIDGVAISLSGLCLIHCLLLPILSAALPIAGVWAEAEWLHKAFVLAAVPFSFLALSSAPANLLVRGLIVSGLVCLASGAFVEAFHDYETQLTVLGGILLAAGHALRWFRAYGADQS